MFVPSYNNNFSLRRCNTCGTTFCDHIHISICRNCRQKEDEETEKPKEQTGFFNDDFLLPVYYMRKIEISFQKEMDKDMSVKYTHLYTVMMIPNKESYLKEKLEEMKNKMEKSDYKKIEFKMLGEYGIMDDTQINHYYQNSVFTHQRLLFPYIELPFVAEYNDSLEEKIICISSIRGFYTHVIKKKLSGMDWLQLIMKILVVIMIIFLLVTGAFSLVVFVSEIISGHYSHSIGPFALFTICVFGSWAMIKILRDIFLYK